MRRRELLIISMVLFVVVAGLGVISGINPKQSLTLRFAADTDTVTAIIYRLPNEVGDVDPSIYTKKENQAGTATSTVKLSLKKGRYLVEATGDGYEKQLQQVSLEDEEQTVNITPDYTSEKMTSLLANEQSAIRQAILAAVPTAKNYDIKTGNLYERGKWYTTTLSIRLSETEQQQNYIDTYRLIAKKEGSSWKVITIPPELVISKLMYPNIPSDVRDAANNL